jgi:uncharacterized protein DUF4384
MNYTPKYFERPSGLACRIKAAVARSAPAFLIFVALVACASLVRAQRHTPGKTEDKAGPKPAPAKPKSGGPITRSPMLAPLLGFEWRLLRLKADNTQEEVNPNSVFKSGERLRLAIKVNQDGYLYVIYQAEGEAARVVFPDAKDNDGQNYIKKELETRVPSYCPDSATPKDCWWDVSPPAGSENITMIFSRAPVPDIVKSVGLGGRIEAANLASIKASPGQSIRRTPQTQTDRTGKRVGYRTWVMNTNAKDNLKIIETIVLKTVE